MGNSAASYEYPSLGTTILILTIAVASLAVCLWIAHVILCKVERKLGIRPNKKELEEV